MSERVMRAKKRADKNTKPFTDLWIRKKLKPPKSGQELYWDEGCRGLSLLVGRKTKTFRATFKLNGEWISVAIGRFGEMVPNADPKKENVQIGKAREIVADYRAKAADGIDPRDARKEAQAAAKLTYEYVVDQFIEHYAKPRQRRWDQTERVLKRNCKGWLKKPIARISKRETYELLDGFVADGHPYKAAVTLAWLKTLWKWAWKRDLVATPFMEAVEIHYEKRVRDRVYADDEIRATWRAANKLPAVEGAFAKLIILLAPRKTELATMRRTDLDNLNKPTLWTTPFESTKSRKVKNVADEPRVYLTPLVPLVQRNLQPLLKKGKDDRVFPGLPVHMTKAGRPVLYSKTLTRKLIKHGAPKDLQLHTWRHTISTWLENKGHSKWERGLVLNHSESGTVTSAYSHGYPLELKRALLTKWSDHVEGLVQPGAKVAVLR